MTSQAVERMWICMGGYGQLRGKWVKFHKLWQHVMAIDSMKRICLTVFPQCLEFLEKSWNLPSNFPDLEKVWKTEIKSWKNGKKSWVFFESCNKCITGEIFFCVGQILFSLACILFAVHHGKSFVPAFFLKVWLSIDHLFDNFESWKRNYCYIWKTSGKSGSKNSDEACSQLEGWGICSLLTKYDVVGVGHLSTKKAWSSNPWLQNKWILFLFFIVNILTGFELC